MSLSQESDQIWELSTSVKSLCSNNKHGSDSAIEL